MKVILLQDVAKAGHRFEIVDVPTGYALNKLIPKGMAEAATNENIKKLKARTDKFAENKADLETNFSKAIANLEGKDISIPVKTNDKGHLFEALKVTTIVDALKTNDAEFSEEQIVIMTPIKEVGEHTVTLTEGSLTTKIILNVISA